MVLIGLLCLVVFGPKRLPEIAREAGRFASQTQNVIEEFRSELDLGENDEEFEEDEKDEWENEEEVSADQEQLFDDSSLVAEASDEDLELGTDHQETAGAVQET